MEFTSFQILEVLASASAGMVLGGVWYSPLVFGAAWMSSIGKTPDNLGSQVLPMVGSAIASLLTAVGVSILSENLNINSAVHALFLGLVLGVLVIFPALLSDSLFCGWGNRLLLIQSGYRVITVILMSLVIHYV